MGMLGGAVGLVDPKGLACGTGACVAAGIGIAEVVSALAGGTKLFAIVSLSGDTHQEAVRPQDISPLEERQFDRYCAGAEDPCGALKAAITQAVLNARKKMNNMLDDPQGLYGSRGWHNHAEDLKGRLNSIAAMIAVGLKIGCDMTKEVAEAATLFVPSRPL